MKNQPLTSVEQSKIMIFSLLLFPTIFVFIGVIPVLFIAFGVFMMNKSKDFSHIETAVRNFRWYVMLIFVTSFLLALLSGLDYGVLAVLFLVSIVLFAYLIFVNKLFLSPLKLHEEWVSANGIFSSITKYQKINNDESEIERIKCENIKSYSVADELLKWAKLKEEGHITEKEFNDAINKLLKRN